jgi:hypothetical protein
MKRRILTFAVTAAAMTATCNVAAADPGAPGSTFPEQPAGHAATACVMVGSNPGTGPGGAFEQNASPQAGAILSALYADACSSG